MTIIDTAREIAQDISRELQIEDTREGLAEGWAKIIQTLADSPLGLDEDVARRLLGL